MASTEYWLWLSSETSVSPQSKFALIEHYGDAERAFAAPEGEYFKVPYVLPSDAKILEKRDLSRVDRIYEACEMNNIGIVTLQDSAYPVPLKSIAAPPVVLYVRGTLPNLSRIPAVSVVGTRKASRYGLKMAERMGAELALGGAAVLSGLTAGIDRAAAKGCLSQDGICIGVLGTAHDKVPGELEEDIIAKGAVVSEYPTGEKVYKSFFRDRNRITAGLGIAVVAVEAPMQSGTLLFAAEAAEQGREIFAVPGNADSLNSEGTNSLIKQGAKLVTCGWDVLSEYEYIYPGMLHKPDTDKITPAQPAEAEAAAEPAKEKQENTKDNTDDNNEVNTADWREQLKALNAEQLQIISAMEGSACHTDEIIAATGLSAAKVLGNLTLLEIKGYIKREPGKKIVLNIAKK